MPESRDEDCTSAYVTFPAEDGSSVCWPNPLDPMEVEWALRYSRESGDSLFGTQPSLTREQQLYAASVISAYCKLFGLSQRTRNLRIEQIRREL
jgi:hypothetical protein